MADSLDINGLTERERLFVASLARGNSKKAAALAAGVPPKGASVWASVTLKRERVQQAFRAEQMAVIASRPATTEEFDTAYVMRRLKELDGGHRDSIALNAVRMMAQHLGMFPERIVFPDPKDMTTEELMRKRAELRKRAGLSA